MLLWRTVTAAVLAPIVIGAIWIGDWAVLALVLLVTGLAAYELSRALNPLPFIAALGAGYMPILLSIPYELSGIMAGAVLGLPWALFWMAGKPEARTLRAVLAILLMALWVGAPLAHIGLLAQLEGAATLIVIAVMGPWLSDSGAYFFGRLFGRHPAFPSLSPKKTIEGSVGGLLVTILVVGWISMEFLNLPMGQAAFMGAAISIFSQSGDLFESILKRILDIKDLGKFLPGHGGMLDRIDSLLFTAPAVYYIFLLL